MLDPVTSFVVTVFHTPGAALAMAGAILLFGLALIIYSQHKEYRPLLLELLERTNLIAGMNGVKGRKAFFEQFERIDLRFRTAIIESAMPAALVLGWSNYRSLLVENNGVFATTSRAADAFDKLDAPARSLEWWANILVATGLVITFLGIVAALTEATSAMSSGGGSDNTAMQTALFGLLTIAATKFWTSIAGVLASIILRLIARFRRKRIEEMEAGLFERLDGCVYFMPLEKVMIEQLQSLRRLETVIPGDVRTKR